MNRAAYLDANHHFELRNSQIPEPATNEVLIEIKANGICGSDIHFYAEGRLGNFVVDRPYIPGHEASGTVVATGGSVKDFIAGDHVVIEPGIPCGQCTLCRSGRYNLCRDVVFLSAPPINGTFCDYIVIREDCVFKVPKSLSFEEAALVEPVAVAIHAINRADFRSGQTAAIVGAGPIGLLTMQAFKATGGGVTTCIDVLDHRLDTARKLGADVVINAKAVGDQIADLADVVFETAGSAAATRQLFHIAKPGGTVFQVGWPGGNIVPMDVAEFLDKELKYLAVNRYANAYPAAIQFISDGRVRVRELITHRFTLNEIAEAFRYSSEHRETVIKTVVLNGYDKELPIATIELSSL